MDITLGAEEELQVVDRQSGELVDHDKSDDGQEVRQGGTLTGEIHRCVIETQSVVCSDVSSLMQAMAGLRLRAFEQARPQGQTLVAAGVHPFSSWQHQRLYDCPTQHPHYAHLLHEYQDVARGALSFGLHLHLGLNDSPFKMHVMNGLREVLPEVLALSASAPFFEGRDTGLCSWRHSLLGRYPRMGIPEVWRTEDDYWDHLQALRNTRCVEMHHGMWEDMRLHHVYRTIEVRIADSTPCLTRVRLMACLLQAQALMLHWEAEQGVERSFWSKACVEENKWRVRRHGMQAKVIDWNRHLEISMPERLARWVEQLQPALASCGHLRWVSEAMPMIQRTGSYADEMLRMHREEGMSIGKDMVLSMAQRTHQEALAMMEHFAEEQAA